MYNSVFKKIKKPLFSSKYTAFIIYWCIRFLFLTYRLQINKTDCDPRTNDGIFYFWHQDIFAGMFFFFKTKSQGHCVVSPSNDGKLIGNICTNLGFTVLFGSAFKNPTSLLRNCLKALKDSGRLCLIGDGSRGPAFQLQPGIPFLATKTNKPIYFIHCNITQYIENKRSWDRFRIPLPFSTITITIQEQNIPLLSENEE